ncbi:MAG: dihydrolipoyl dehydrogenase [Alphaproteobacteria bacterium]|nr:dihydrolipoyl dehydrogenase [Alphaproteobacteria bacterium]
MDSFDVIVIGGGPGGYVCAIRAAQLGLKTAIVERDRLGGICLNWGCIPTKALLRSSEVWHLMHRLDEFGFAADNLRFDLGKVVARSRKVAGQLSDGVSFLMKKHKIEVISGKGVLKGSGIVAVATDKGERSMNAKNIVLATGARARTTAALKPDGKKIWTYREAMVPAEMPKTMLIVGSGAIGIEFASFYRTLGCEVTVVEVLDRVLPAEDEEISGLAAKAFRKQHITLRTSCSVEKLEASQGGVRATLSGGGKQDVLDCERVILALGIVGNVEDIGLEALGIRTEKSHVIVDRWGATGVNGVYAIGDLVGPPWLAHKAMHEGVLAAERIAGMEGIHPLDTTKVPACTYSWPQIASVGLTEKRAKEEGYKVKVGKFPFIGNGKAIAMGDQEGLIKTVFDSETGELLGAHMIGAEVTELIQGYAIARTLESTDADLAATIFPHPTLSEMLHEAVLSADNRALHI